MAPAPRTPSSRQGALERWARFSHRHRWQVAAVWLVLLMGLFAANFVFGGTYVSEFNVPGAESQTAQDLLKAHSLRALG